MEMAELAGLDGTELEDAFYLGLLHSIGCTADSPVTARAFGDDGPHKAAYTLIDAGRPVVPRVDAAATLMEVGQYPCDLGDRQVRQLTPPQRCCQRTILVVAAHLHHVVDSSWVFVSAQLDA